MAARKGPVRWLHRLGFGAPEPDASVTLEIDHHVAELADRLVAEGWGVEEANREAGLRATRVDPVAALRTD
jgi:hypothetical protein